MTGYLFLALTIVTTTWIMVGLRELKRWNIPLFQAITWNYIAASLFGVIRSPDCFSVVAAEPGALYTSVFLGLSFILLFFLLGIVAQKVGVGYMTVVTKMSLVIPTIFAWFYYNEEISALSGLGIALAVISVVLVNYRPNAPIKLSDKGAGWISILLVLLLFIGTGINDIMFKVFNEEFSETVSTTDFPVVIFAIAGIVGTLISAYQIMAGKVKFDVKAVIAGIVIGVPNYFSIFFFVEALDYFPATVFFPVNNISLLVVTALIGMFVYREKFNRFNFAGLALAILAVILIM